MSTVERFRTYRTTKLEPVTKFLLKLHITANSMTTISLLSGLAAIYFLLQNHVLFIIFALLHLVSDALDGVIARHSTPTKTGSYFDAITDATINFGAIAKLAIALNDLYFYLICILFILVYILYFVSTMTLPLIQSRTITLIILFFLPIHPVIPYLAIFTTGFCVLFSGAKMIEMQAPRWFSK